MHHLEEEKKIDNVFTWGWVALPTLTASLDAVLLLCHLQVMLPGVTSVTGTGAATGAHGGDALAGVGWDRTGCAPPVARAPPVGVPPVRHH